MYQTDNIKYFQISKLIIKTVDGTDRHRQNIIYLMADE